MFWGNPALVICSLLGALLHNTRAHEAADMLPEFKCDEKLYFLCENQKCISKAFICDGENDCEDKSDEKHCSQLSTVLPKCSERQYTCRSHECIPQEWVCDGQEDCVDGSDEDVGCTISIPCDDGFRCKNGHCLPSDWHCDGGNDCGDNSDEENCEREKTAKEDCTIENRFFLCADHSKCLNMGQLCNSHADCSDGSDEGGKCSNIDVCLNSTCKFECHLSPVGDICTCPKGYKLQNGTCEDIDECKTYGICDHICQNTNGSFNCFCRKGYELHTDKKTCKAEGGEGVLVFSNSDEVRALYLSSGFYYPVATGLKEVSGVAYDGQRVYWAAYGSDEGPASIITASELGTDIRPLVTSGVGAPEGLAVDWVTRNIYFTDAEYRRIGVCANDGSVCSVIVNKDIDKPRAIALHSAEGSMYWTDWGERPLIAKAWMDGSHVEDFVVRDIFWPNGVTIDHASRRVYWLEAKNPTIESINFDGTDRRKVLTGSVRHPFSIAVFENLLYWSDWEGNEIKACNKFTGKDVKIIVKEKNKKILGIHIFHPSIESGNLTNPCRGARCSDLCLLSASERGYSCGCPEDKELAANGHDCRPSLKSQSLVVGFGHTLLTLEPRRLGKRTITEHNFPNIGKITAMAYDSKSGRILIGDGFQHRIFSLELGSEEVSPLVDSHLGTVSGMDYDPSGNNLYWVDSERRVLEVLSLTTLARKTLVADFGGDTPWDLALIPDDGIMFVSLGDGVSQKIDRMQMDGSLNSRTRVVEKGLLGPEITLAYDSHLHRVFWTDKGNGKIMSTDNTGLDRHEFRRPYTSVVDVAFLQNDAYWVNYASNKLFMGDKYDGEKPDSVIKLERAAGYNDIRLTTATGVIVDQSHVCQVKNGGCSHICLSAGKVKRCECPSGMRLEEDGLRCHDVKRCEEEEFQCSSGECIPHRMRCDHKFDCPGHEDERGCERVERTCPPDSFRCHGTRVCLDGSRRCDGTPDCDDGSDEINCLKHCDDESKFKCVSGECISAAWRCDEKADCEDGSDEVGCRSRTCTPDAFRCGSGACIPANWECDSQVDCTDASDEHPGCSKSKECERGFFRCNNSECVDEKMVCDGFKDCDDGSDEGGCPTTEGPPPAAVACPPDQFQCAEQQPTLCLPRAALCNGTSECQRGEDEAGCEGCGKEQFTCANGRCLPRAWLCDKRDDCGDGSDEHPTLCPQHHPDRPENTKCTAFQCEDGKKCIPFGKVCNSHPDCDDGSDEGGKCGSHCESSTCADLCHETPYGAKCDCRHGYQLGGDARSCSDIDECRLPSACSQLCTNTPGSFLCSCHEPEYRIRDDRTRCKAKGPQMEFLFVSQREIKYKAQTLSRTGLVFRFDTKMEISGMDVDMKNRLIYFTSGLYGTLTKISMDNGEDHIQASNLVKPTKVAFDWLTGNVYVVEKGYTIRACNLNYMRCGLVYNAPRDVFVNALAVDAVSGLMFWSETSTEIQGAKSILKQGEMSGANVKTILSHDLHSITDISINPIRHHIYWVDGISRKIERATYNGSNRELLFTSMDPPIDIGLFEDHVYWSNGKPYKGHEMYSREGMINKCGLYGSVKGNCEYLQLLPQDANKETQRFRIVHPAIQIHAYNVCEAVNCTYMCVKSTSGANCLCPDGTRVGFRELCPISQGIHLNPILLQKYYEEESSSAGLWIFFSVILLCFSGALAYLGYRFQPWTGLRKGAWPSVYFRNPMEGLNVSHHVSSVHHTRLTPGQHQYENPITVKDQEPQVKLQMQNEMTICNGGSSWKDFKSRLEPTEDDSTEYADIMPEHNKAPLISG